MNNELVVKLKNVTKQYRIYENNKAKLFGVFNDKVSYRHKTAVNNLSLEIHSGESVAIFGKNGAGKSTTLKIITGVVHPTSGIVRVNGRVSALLELLGMSDEEIHEIEDNIIAYSEIGDYIDQPIRTYSSGMKARLGFAININLSPDIVIVDEALSVGDRNFQAKCRKSINELLKEDITFILVTHSTTEAQKLCKRGIVINDGVIVFDGDIKDAVAYYAG